MERTCIKSIILLYSKYIDTYVYNIYTYYKRILFLSTFCITPYCLYIFFLFCSMLRDSLFVFIISLFQGFQSSRFLLRSTYFDMLWQVSTNLNLPNYCARLSPPLFNSIIEIVISLYYLSRTKLFVFLYQFIGQLDNYFN